MNRAGWVLLSAALMLVGCDRGSKPADPSEVDGPSDRPTAGAPSMAGSKSPATTPSSDAASPTPTAIASATASPAQAAAGACLTQDGERLAVAPLRAVGTEPFWGARIEGRCVTYSHPDDQQGTRVWTRYSEVDTRGGVPGRIWRGNLGGQPFVLQATPQKGCSDGMSDRRYPFAVSLTVGGEQRTGCAEPR